MQMFDKASGGNADLELMAQKQEKLVRKLGSDHIQNLSVDAE